MRTAVSMPRRIKTPRSSRPADASADCSSSRAKAGFFSVRDRSPPRNSPTVSTTRRLSGRRHHQQTTCRPPACRQGPPVIVRQPCDTDAPPGAARDCANSPVDWTGSRGSGCTEGRITTVNRTPCPTIPRSRIAFEGRPARSHPGAGHPRFARRRVQPRIRRHHGPRWRRGPVGRRFPRCGPDTRDAARQRVTAVRVDSKTWSLPCSHARRIHRTDVYARGTSSLMAHAPVANSVHSLNSSR